MAEDELAPGEADEIGGWTLLLKGGFGVDVPDEVDASAFADEVVFCAGSKAGAVDEAELRNSARKAILHA